MPNSASLTLDGTGDYASRNGTDDAVLDLTTTWTMEAWIYSSSYNDELYIACKGPILADNENVPFGLMCRYNNLTAGYRNGFTSYTHEYGISGLSTSTWHHVAATYESQVIRLYIDGALVSTSGSLGAAPVGNSESFSVGARLAGGTPGNYWNGKIDEVRVWNVRRADADVADYDDKQAAGSESGLAGCWRFNSSLADQTSNALTLTLHGDATYDTSVYPTLTDAGGSKAPPPFQRRFRVSNRRRSF